MPQLSIITPLKNAQKWVQETIESIQQQSFSDWELIVIDDFSDDNSVEIVQDLAKKDPRILLFKNENQGIVSALETAMKYVSGIYLTRMDADDLMPENRLQTMISTLEKQPQMSIVTGKVQYFSNGTISKGYKKYEHWLNELVEHQSFYKHIFRECIVASPNWMGRTEEFQQFRLLENLTYPEDYDLCFRWKEHGFSVVGVNETTLLWREHPQRTSRNSNNYNQQTFFNLKLSWFVNWFANAKSVGIIGAGDKGKLCADYFSKVGFPFNIYDIKSIRFYGQQLYGKTVLSPNEINDEILLLARYPENLEELEHFIENKGYEIGKNAFWV